MIRTGSLYFYNEVFYYMIYNLSNPKNSDFLTKCQYLENNITLADRSTILSEKIGTVILIFCNKDSVEKILLSGVYYYSELDTKLIFMKMQNCKDLTYPLHNGILKFPKNTLPIIENHLIFHNL